MEKKKFEECNNNVMFEDSMSQIGLDNFSDFYNSTDCSNYKKYAQRIKKSLYYGRIPTSDRPSLSVTEILVEKFSELCNTDGLDNLEFHDAASICYDACVTPCSVIVALLYLDRLRTTNPDYLAKTSPSQVFVVAMMVASKYLYDDGEEDEVFNDEWASSAAMMLMDLNQAERNFLSAIDWNLFVDVKRFLNGLAYVEAEVSQREAMSRGFFVYSDLVAISQFLPPLWNSLLNIVGSAFVVCIVGYTAMVATTTIVGNVVGIHVANCFEHIYTSPVPQLTNHSKTLELCGDIEGDIVLNTVNAAENEYAGYTSKENSYDSARDVQNKNLVKFHALHTLTAAFLLASSTASTKVADIILSLPIPNESSFPLTRVFEHCLNCLVNLSYPGPFSGKKVHMPNSNEKSRKINDSRRISYSRRRYQKEISKKSIFINKDFQHPNEDSSYFTDIEYLQSSNLQNSDFEERMNLENHNSGITVISISNPRLANYFILTTKDIGPKRLNYNFHYLGLREPDETIPPDEDDFGYMWTNEILRNATQFVSPIKQSNDVLLDIELPWFLEKKMSSSILNLFTTWMWSSLPSTLYQNINEIMSFGWQVQSLSLFI